MTIKAGIFDLDGVITDTSKLHFIAWKNMFDDYLNVYALQHGQSFQPFTLSDYHFYVDGKPRLEGIQSFLQSRHINLPLGSKTHKSKTPTLYTLGEAKQHIYIQLINQQSIPVFSSTIDFIHQLHANNIKTAVVSSSYNCQMLLKRAGIEHLFTTRVDGVVSEKLGLAGKPQPDLFLEAAKLMQINPSDAFIVEDALAGVQAGHAGHFALVIGIDRTGDREALFFNNGADVVVHDMCEVKIGSILS